MSVDIGISAENGKKVIEILNTMLANANILCLKTKKYHWNVVSPNFNELHELFEEQMNIITNNIEIIATRIRMLGGEAMGTFEEYKALGVFKEEPGSVPNDKKMIKNLLADHELAAGAIRQSIPVVREKYNDYGSAHILEALLIEHEKAAWKLRSYIE